MFLKLRDAARKGDLTAFVPPRFPSARRAASAVNAYSAADEDDDDAHDPNYVAGQQAIRAFRSVSAWAVAGFVGAGRGFGGGEIAVSWVAENCWGLRG